MFGVFLVLDLRDDLLYDLLGEFCDDVGRVIRVEFRQFFCDLLGRKVVQDGFPDVIIELCEDDPDLGVILYETMARLVSR